MTANFVPVNEPLLEGNELAYLAECVKTGWISSEGPFVTRFEQEFSAYVGRAHGIAVANGSVALDLAFAALQLEPGSEVILPTFTIISCAAAIVRAGLRPVLVDCDPRTWNMTAADVEAKITPKTRAILVVHIYGLPVEMDLILALAERHGLQIVEDAAEMHGQVYNGRRCGSFGALSIFSFYPNKVITTGEGGMVVTDDPALAERCRLLRNLAFVPGRRFVHEELGWNFRMTNLQAALGVAQLERIETLLSIKRAIGRRYNERFRDVAGITTGVERTDYAESLYWVYGLVLDDSVPFDAAHAIEWLGRHGVGCRPFFWCMHEQPVFRQMHLFDGERYPHAERLARRGFYIPSGMA
ncbi:MAG: perosamine synthetase, partial [Acidobacteriota bacterium]|nr:perosamine synthetase [Acidobacteriota bacterium]